MDRRIKYTKKVLKEVTLELLNEKEINKITVSEICRKADVNRATFYRYYLDVFDLVDKIVKEFVEELKITLENNTETSSISSFSENLLNVFLDNKELVKIIFNNKNHANFLNDVLEIAYEKCSKKWQEDNPNISKEELEYASLFIFNGALGVVNYWIKNDFDKSVEEISNIIEQLSHFGTKRYIYKK